MVITMSDEIANNSNNNEKNDEKKSIDGRNFGLEMAEAFIEAGLIGTLVNIILVALSNLPVYIISAAQAPYVSLVVGAIITIVQIRKAFKRNYH